MAKITDQDVLDTLHLTSREAAEQLGVGKTTINDARKRLKLTAEHDKVNHPNSGTGDTMAEALEDLRQGKSDLSEHNLSYTVVERELADGSVKHQYTVYARTGKGADKPTLPDPEEMFDTLRSWKYEPQDLNPQSAPVYVVCPADLQVGKVSDKGGTEQLVARVKASFDRAADKARGNGGYHAIVVADLGDIIENFYNTSSQAQTNDVDLTTQVRIARQLMMYGISVLAPWCRQMYVVSVPSNHGSVRIGKQQDAAHPSNDWGVEVNHQLQDTFAMSEDYSHVEFVRPSGLDDAVGLNISVKLDNYTDTTRFGFVHGHQAGKAAKLPDWWRGQALGRGSVSQADILLSGHFHSFRQMQAGDERWIIVAPSSDNGSDWYRRLTGDVHTAGMLTFEATNGSWRNMEIV